MCPETGVEYEQISGEQPKLVNLVDPDVSISKMEVWIKFSVYRDQLKNLHLSRRGLLELVTLQPHSYHQVQSSNREHWSFESENTKKITATKGPHEALAAEILKMNAYVIMEEGKPNYLVPIQTHLPVVLPQIMTLYSLIFWLASISTVLPIP